MGAINGYGIEFLDDLGRRITQLSHIKRHSVIIALFSSSTVFNFRP